MNFVEKLLTSRGGLSSMRWVFIWTYLYVVVLVFGVWAAVYVWTKGVADLPIVVAGLAGTIISVITGGKYLQSKEEAKGAVVPESEEPASSSPGSGAGSNVAGSR